MYDNLEAVEKKLCVESLVKKAEIGKGKEIQLTLHVPFGEFRVLIPHLSATGLNNRKTLILHLNYNLSVYYKNLPRKALFYSPYSKKQFVV